MAGNTFYCRSDLNPTGGFYPANLPTTWNASWTLTPTIGPAQKALSLSPLSPANQQAFDITAADGITVNTGTTVSVACLQYIGPANMIRGSFSQTGCPIGLAYKIDSANGNQIAGTTGVMSLYKADGTVRTVLFNQVGSALSGQSAQSVENTNFVTTFNFATAAYSPGDYFVFEVGVVLFSGIANWTLNGAGSNNIYDGGLTFVSKNNQVITSAQTYIQTNINMFPGPPPVLFDPYGRGVMLDPITNRPMLQRNWCKKVSYRALRQLKKKMTQWAREDYDNLALAMALRG